MLRMSICSLALLLVVFAADARGQDATRQADDREAEIRHLIGTLEDPAARERLVDDLELLLETQLQDGSGDSKPARVTEFDLLGLARELASGFWDRIMDVDPKQMAVSAGLSVALLGAALLLRWLLLALLRRLYRRLARSDEDDETTGEPSATRQGDRKTESQLPVAVSRTVNVLVGVLAIALIAESWGAGLSDLLRTELGGRMAEAIFAVGFILLITVALWNAAHLLVERLLKLGSRKLDRERTVRRLDTLVPLLTSVLQMTISVMSVLLVLSELGVNIGPLLAGAGILGLAVGFGAQTLVKDLITGVTILLEDSATVGDVVEVAGHAGRVEEMRIRIMRLRDLSGVVHLIPYSDVSTIMNFSKDFSYSLFEVGVAYRENTDEVCELLKEIGDGMRGSDDFGNNILEPLDILGVDRFADSAVIIKARIKTVAGQQWAIGREFNRRMKHRFDEEGIEIPFPHSTIYFGEPRDGTAPPMQLALAGVAEEKLEQLATGDKE